MPQGTIEGEQGAYHEITRRQPISDGHGEEIRRIVAEEAVAAAAHVGFSAGVLQ